MGQLDPKAVAQAKANRLRNEHHGRGRAPGGRPGHGTSPPPPPPTTPGTAPAIRTSTNPNPYIGGYRAHDPYVNGRSRSSGGFPDDGSVDMPSINDPAFVAASRRRVLNLRSRSGRTSTDLSSGTSGYSNVFLGGNR